MLKYIILALLGIAGALASLYFWVGSPRLHEYAGLDFSRPHVFGDSQKTVDRIRISAVYFVPKDKQKDMSAEWRELLDENFKKLQAFHALQFQERSAISFAVYPEPVIGLEEHLFYDTTDTNRGNPKALLNVSEELEERLFSSEGDLYRHDFWQKGAGGYPALFILYEGVGAIGGIIAESERESVADIARELGLPESVIFKVGVKAVDGFFLLSRTFLADPEYRAFGASLLAHEFYHTLGIPDAYDQDTGKPESADIMGLGRYRPIEKTYVRREVVRALGL